jgi:hypothetical protein
MRDLKLIKRCLILLALVWAQIPASVLAGLHMGSSSCKMPCCVGKQKPTPDTQKPACKMCSSEQSLHSVGTNSQNLTGVAEPPVKDRCPCKIAPRPAPPAPLGALASSPPAAEDHSVDACLPTSGLMGLNSDIASALPGIVGLDSGPPTQRPCCVWFGRAPPILVA